MKKIVLVTAALAMAASSAYGAAAVGVSGTKHDLSATSSLTGASNTQLCIYCHTPHNPAQSVPLWNRNNLTSTITVYNSSATLTATAAGASISVSSISGFCMSCHDGATAMGAIKNKAGATDAGILIGGVPSANAKNNIGTDMSNDHPVGFNYASAVADEIDGGLKSLDAVTGQMANSFFGTSKQDMECASCHKVHDDRLTPFLRINNAGSNLCLACHNK